MERKPGWQSCSRSPPAASRAPRPPYPAQLGAVPGAEPRRPRTATAGAPPPPRAALGGGEGGGLQAALVPAPLPAPAAAVAVRVELGSPPAAGGAARSRPGDAGRGRGPPAPPASPAPAEREVAANKCKLLGPPGRLGEDPRSGARLPPARVGFAAGPRGAGASPCAAGARWRGASRPPRTQLQVNAEAQSACHRSRSPSAFISGSDPGCVTSSVWL